MDVAVLLFLPLVGGYIFASSFERSRYALAREDGHRLYFRAIFWGVALFAAALSIHLLCFISADWYRELVNSLKPTLLAWFKEPQKGDPLDITASAVGALLIAYPFANLLNWLFKFRQPAWIADAIAHDDIERLLHKAASERSPVAVYMANRKMYVGFVLRTFDPAKARKSISLLPLVSGYRRDDDGTLVLTTYYTDVYGEQGTEDGMLSPPLDHLAPEDFEIALPLELVQSINQFDLQAYAEFQRTARDKNSPTVAENS